MRSGLVRARRGDRGEAASAVGYAYPNVAPGTVADEPFVADFDLVPGVSAVVAARVGFAGDAHRGDAFHIAKERERFAHTVAHGEVVGVGKHSFDIERGVLDRVGDFVYLARAVVVQHAPHNPVVNRVDFLEVGHTVVKYRIEQFFCISVVSRRSAACHGRVAEFGGAVQLVCGADFRRLFRFVERKNVVGRSARRAYMRVYTVERERGTSGHDVFVRRFADGIKREFERADIAFLRDGNIVRAGVTCAVERDLREPRGRVRGRIAHIQRVSRVRFALSRLCAVQHKIVVNRVEFVVRSYIIIAAVPRFT